MSNVTAKETIERLSKYSELIGAKSQQMIEAGNKHEYSTVIKIQNEIKVFELEVSRLQSELLGGYGQLQQLPIKKEDATAGTDGSVIAAGGSEGSTLSQKKESPKKKKITVKLRPGSNNDTQKLKLPTYRERPKKQHDQIANNNDNETAKAMKVSEERGPVLSHPPPHNNHNPHEGPAFIGNNNEDTAEAYCRRQLVDPEYYDRLVNMLGQEGADEIVKDSVNETFVEAVTVKIDVKDSPLFCKNTAVKGEEGGADSKDGSNEKKSPSGVQESSNLEPQKLSERMDTVPEKSPVSYTEQEASTLKSQKLSDTTNTVLPSQKQESSSKQRTTSNNNHDKWKYLPSSSVVWQGSVPKECTFPYKLYATLEDESSSGIIKWLDHGRGFKLLDKDSFEKKVLQVHFKAKKTRSFQRQLNLWGFNRVVDGPDIGAWWHPHFVKNHPEHMKHMSRVPIKGAVYEDPNFLYSGGPDYYQMLALLLSYGDGPFEGYGLPISNYPSYSNGAYYSHAQFIKYCTEHEHNSKLSADHYAQQDRYAQTLQRMQHQQLPSYNNGGYAQQLMQEQAYTNRHVSTMYPHLYPSMSSNQSDRDHPTSSSTNNPPCNVQHSSAQTSYTSYKALQRAATPRENNDTASSTTDEKSKSEACTSSKSDDAEKNTAVYLTEDAMAHLNSVDPLKGLECLADMCAFHSKPSKNGTNNDDPRLGRMEVDEGKRKTAESNIAAAVAHKPSSDESECTQSDNPYVKKGSDNPESETAAPKCTIG